jgi:hypothetical protein
MAMNFAPLDCSCQGASSEPKKIYLDFSVSEKFAKNQKIHIFGSHSKKYGFFDFLRISLKRKNPGKFFSAQKKRLDKSNPTVQNSLPYVA